MRLRTPRVPSPPIPSPAHGRGAVLAVRAFSVPSPSRGREWREAPGEGTPCSYKTLVHREPLLSGFAFGRFNNLTDHSSRITEYLVVGESNNSVARRAQQARSFFVLFCYGFMNSTIKLDY
jgi:hypothetical protein